MTTYLASLALHASYNASDSVIIGDDSGSSIANIDSFSLTSLPIPFFFLLSYMCLPFLRILFRSRLCVDNPINVLFFDSFFQVKDHHAGVTLVCEHLRDGVYYWPKLFPPLVYNPRYVILNSVLPCLYLYVAQSLDHPSLPSFQIFLSVLSISFPK